MRIIPAIDIIDGKCVRLTQGNYDRKTIYNNDPLDVAKSFEAAGITYLHLVDLDGAKAGAVTNWKIVEQITSKTNLQVDFGGGIKTEKEIDKLLDLGVRQVNLGSIAVKQADLVYEWIAKIGSAKIILSADVINEKVKIDGWQENSGLTIQELIQNYKTKGLEFVTCTDISTDGMLLGPNVDLYKGLLKKFPGIKFVASGGVSSLKDLSDLKRTGVDGVIIGKAIYENKITLNDLRQFINGG